MPESAVTYATRLTSLGRGAIASILVAGPAATAIVARLLIAPRGATQLEPWGHIRFGRWQHAGGEEVIVAATDSERCEIHCHGGIAAPAAILATLAQQGCHVLDWPQWLARVPSGSMHNAAVAALAAATTERAAAVLLDQHQGALAAAGRHLGQLLDRRIVVEARAAVDELLQWASFGLHLAQPWRVVLAGPPNVGKSSLINALLGYQRSIVFDQPGTTRDVVSAPSALGGWPVELSDTAGLRSGADALEAAGILLAEQQLDRADAIVLVFDARAAWQPANDDLLARWPQAMVVYNKCDLAAPATDGRPAGIATSALLRQGLPALEEAIVKRLVPRVPPTGTAVPFTAEQVAMLSELLAALERGDWDAIASAARPLRDASISVPSQLL